MRINILQWRYSLFLLLGFGLFGVEPAHAVVKCDNPEMDDLTFSDIDSQSTQRDTTAEFEIKCENTSEYQTRGATICVSIGPQRQMKNGSAMLNFQLYQDSSHSVIWGSQFGGSSEPYKFDVVLGPDAQQRFYAKLHGHVLAGQTGAIPGKYRQEYRDNSASVTVNAPNSNSAPNSCNTNYDRELDIEFKVEVLMIKNCQVTTTGALDLGSVMSGIAPTITSSGTNLINVTCTNGTPYNIGLSPSNGNVNGMGVMKNSTATDIIPYQLQSNASGKVWGNNNVTSTTVGNGVEGRGTGITKGYAVFTTVSNTDVKPDSYSDTVTVHVNY